MSQLSQLEFQSNLSNEVIKVAAFSPYSKPKRFLALCVKVGDRVAVKSIEPFGSTLVPYQPYRVQERLHSLQNRGFYVITDSDHESFSQFPHYRMDSRDFGSYINRDHALDHLQEYAAAGLLTLPPDLPSVVPSTQDYRRDGSGLTNPYVFRQYKPETHVVLLAMLALLHPPTLSEVWVDNFVDAYFNSDSAKNSDSMSTFRRITSGVDKDRYEELDRNWTPE